MSEPQNNFQIFNVNNSQYTTMSDEEYASLDYRINGLIPMIADPLAHNKMYRQWSVMIKAVSMMIGDKGYDALDTDATYLKNNLKLSIKDLARDELQSDITDLQTNKSNTGHTHLTADITDFASAASGISAEILDQIDTLENQVNSITGAINSPFPAWTASISYAVGDICIASNFNSYKYLECVIAGTTDTTMPNNANVGQLVTDNEVKWLVCDFRDSAPVGAFRSDMIQRLGWLKANGATVNRADYPRLWTYAVDNFLTTNDQTNNPGLFGEGDGVDTFELPNFEDYFIRYSYTRGVGTKQNSQMAQHNHSCSNQDTSHTHSCGNQSTNHTHSVGNQSINHNHTFKNANTIVQAGAGATLATLGGNLTTTTTSSSITHNHTLGNQSNNHNHSIGNQSASHKHNIGNTGSGSNTYPDNITMQMYIKY